MNVHANAGFNNVELFIEALRKGTPEIPINLGHFDLPNQDGVKTIFVPPSDLGKRDFYLDLPRGGIPKFLGKVRYLETAKNVKGETIVFGKHFINTGCDKHEQRVRDSFIETIKDHEYFLVHYTGHGRLDDVDGTPIITINNFTHFSLSLS